MTHLLRQLPKDIHHNGFKVFVSSFTTALNAIRRRTFLILLPMNCLIVTSSHMYRPSYSEIHAEPPSGFLFTNSPASPEQKCRLPAEGNSFLSVLRKKSFERTHYSQCSSSICQHAPGLPEPCFSQSNRCHSF